MALCSYRQLFVESYVLTCRNNRLPFSSDRKKFYCTINKLKGLIFMQLLIVFLRLSSCSTVLSLSNSTLTPDDLNQQINQSITPPSRPCARILLRSMPNYLTGGGNVDAVVYDEGRAWVQVGVGILDLTVHLLCLRL